MALDPNVNTLEQQKFRESAGGLVSVGIVGDPLDPIPTGQTTSPQTPLERVVFQCAMLSNAGSESFVVNGSVTPVNFDYAVASGQTIYLESIHVFIQDPGSPDPNDFGSITGGLTNGLKITFSSNGTDYDLLTIKNNMHLGLLFSDTILIPDASGGFFNGNDSLLGAVRFPSPMKMTESSSDKIRASVQDDLSALDFMRIMVKFWRAI